MKFCYNVSENEDKSKHKFHKNIFEKMHVAGKQLHAFSSYAWRDRK